MAMAPGVPGGDVHGGARARSLLPISAEISSVLRKARSVDWPHVLLAQIDPYSGLGLDVGHFSGVP